MSEINEQLERLIVRRLDGELSADEELALERELIKNPEARRLADDYARLDMVAGAALQDALFHGRSAASRPLVAAGSSRPRHWTRGWLFIPGAIAAALLAMVVPFPGATPSRIEPTKLVSNTPSSAPRPQANKQLPQIAPADSDGVMRNVSNSAWLAPRTRRDTGREMIGVQGDDGNIYWLEISRTRTVRQPERAAVAMPVTESL